MKRCAGETTRLSFGIHRFSLGQRHEAARCVEELCRTFHLVPLQPDVLNRAGAAFPTVVGTLDALHLATALLLRERSGVALTILTHDQRMATAARGLGFDVEGA